MLTKNVGKTDRMIRIVLGVVLIAAYFAVSGGAAWLLLLAGIVALATGVLNFCGLYRVLGINTCSIK